MITLKMRAESEKTEWEKLMYLVEHVIVVPSTRDGRDIILMLGLYGEHVTNTLLEIFTTTELQKINQETKIKVLYELKKLNQFDYHTLDMLRQVRNKYVHNLMLSKKQMNKVMGWMSDIRIGVGESIVDKPNEYFKRYPFLKFQIGCLMTLRNLMKKIARKKKQRFPKSSFELNVGDYNVSIGDHNYEKLQRQTKGTG